MDWTLVLRSSPTWIIIYLCHKKIQSAWIKHNTWESFLPPQARWNMASLVGFCTFFLNWNNSISWCECPCLSLVYPCVFCNRCHIAYQFHHSVDTCWLKCTDDVKQTYLSIFWWHGLGFGYLFRGLVCFLRHLRLMFKEEKEETETKHQPNVFNVSTNQLSVDRGAS